MQQQLTRTSHRAAVLITPPAAVSAAIQRVRCGRDKGFVRWPPHINLLYPFIDCDGGGDGAAGAAEAAAAATTAAAVRALPPFTLRLDALSYFQHAPSSFTLWLQPADTCRSELLALQAALQRAWPQCSDLSDDPARGISGFVPHLSLGQWRDKRELLAAMEVLRNTAGLLDVEWDVTEVVNPGELLSEHLPPDHARFGPGAGSDGAAAVWHFSYGANMAPSKCRARGLRPVQSRAAVLRGWQLAFNHRGGFGNIKAAAGDGDSSSSGRQANAPADVHGVLHRLTAADMASLTCAEHEYEPVLVLVQPYSDDAAPAPAPPQAPAAAAQQQPAVPDANVQQQRQQPLPAAVPAIAFVSPRERRIAAGLPPTRRYLDLLLEGARHFRLDQQYQRWLEGHRGAALPDGGSRGPEYYASPTGEPLPAWPKIRVGGSGKQQGGRQAGRRRGARGGAGRGGGGSSQKD